MPNYSEGTSGRNILLCLPATDAHGLALLALRNACRRGLLSADAVSLHARHHLPAGPLRKHFTPLVQPVVWLPCVFRPRLLERNTCSRSPTLTTAVASSISRRWSLLCKLSRAVKRVGFGSSCRMLRVSRLAGTIWESATDHPAQGACGFVSTRSEQRSGLFSLVACLNSGGLRCQVTGNSTWLQWAEASGKSLIDHGKVCSASASKTRIVLPVSDVGSLLLVRPSIGSSTRTSQIRSGRTLASATVRRRLLSTALCCIN
jgi:hypothetical protein